MANSTVSGIEIRDSKCPPSNRACFSVCTSAGTPRGTSAGVLPGRFLRSRVEYEAVQIGSQRARGISITRGSDRNCFRYRRTAAVWVRPALPRLMSRSRSLRPCRADVPAQKIAHALRSR